MTISEADLRRAVLVPGGLWTDVRVLAETDSTNADVAGAAQSGAPEGLVIVAEHQRAGRGRLARRWEAPAGTSIMLSVLLRPGPAARWGWLPLLAGVALVDAVGRRTGVAAALKWPNDLVVRTPDGSDGKCAGILAEAGGDAVVLGIGLNVAQRADQLPPPPDPAALTPTSLALAGGDGLDRTAIIVELLAALADRYQAFRSTGGDPVAAGLIGAYRQRCQTIGQEVTVHLPGGAVVRGTATDIDDDGRLVVATAEGLRPLAAGDVHHVRRP